MMKFVINLFSSKDVGLMWCDFFLSLRDEQKQTNDTKKNIKYEDERQRGTIFISALLTKKKLLTTKIN